jgi:anaerobic magnesium-protoporphyrin IX monomethyl ester cyclase
VGPFVKAVLVGPIQQENLALGYLAAHARTRGHDVSIVSYAYRKELDAAIAAILEKGPDLVGLGIAFQNNVDDYVLLMRELRARGYRGHLTCGGHVGTFCWEELLAELPELDTVVRHDGEETLAEMLEMLARGERPKDIAGLVWREGDRVVKGPVRHASMALDAIPWPSRGAVPYTVGGIVVDFLITARGCVGECSYCSIAAYTSEQRKSYRLRAPEAVADEIAAQYHGRGARVFFVQDDLFVLPGERAAVERMNRLRTAIRDRGVRDAVFWIKGRPENITPAVAAAAREMGAIHMFLGVENASAARLKYLGRTHLPIHNHSAIANCRAAGVMPSFNFMLFDPDSSLEDVAASLDMADQHPDLPWNVCRTEIYSGTALRERLAAEGRLTGDWRSWGYRMRDDRAEMLFRILRISFYERALAIESLLNRLISLSFARQLHVELLPSSITDAIDRAVTEVGVVARKDTVARLREALAFASDPPADPKLVRRYAIEQGLAIGAFDMDLRARVEALWEQLDARGRVLMGRKGLGVERSRAGFEVAAGS